MVSLLIVVFLFSLVIALGASAWFTRRLEVLSDHFRFSPGLLSLLGALGANIPNYVASLTAAISGQVGAGIGIIVGSNIYNIAIILGISTFAAPAGRGIALTHKEARDASLVGRTALTMMLTTAFAVGALAWKGVLPASHPTLFLASFVLFILNVLTLGLFGVLSFHALQREPEVPLLVPQTMWVGRVQEARPFSDGTSKGARAGAADETCAAQPRKTTQHSRDVCPKSGGV